MTIKDLIIKAGGFLKRAEFGTMRLETPLASAESTTVQWLSVDSSLSVAAADHPLLGASHLAIPFDPDFNELELVNVRGWVVRPGLYALTRPDERLSDLIGRAGGIKKDGYAEGAKLTRAEEGTGRISVNFARALRQPGGNLDVPLRVGDIIDVPKRPATIQVRGRVNNPGHVVFTEGKSWSWYIDQAGGYADSAYKKGVFVEYADGSIQTKENGIKDLPNPGSVINIPFHTPPEPATFKDVFSGINAILATVIAGLTIMVLLKK